MNIGDKVWMVPLIKLDGSHRDLVRFELTICDIKIKDDETIFFDENGDGYSTKDFNIK